MPDSEFRNNYKNGITVTTPVSLGLIGGVVVFGFTILVSIWGWGGTISAKLVKHDLVLEEVQQSQAETRAKISTIESHKETWSYQDMFKWAVHLQRDNPQIKVPEPDNTNRN